MKKIILFAAAAALFAACSSDNDLVQQEQPQQATQASDAVSFNAYLNRSTTTRAGVTGGATTNSLKNDPSDTELGAAGFGVFAYYTDNFDYTPLYLPNFMYNEQVTYQSSEFKYSTIKYWPNEHGSAAKSVDQDRVSFFAYLPYVNTDPSTGMLVNNVGEIIPGDDPLMQYGITGMKRNSIQGDPVIQYITSFDQEKSVDLCWGTTGSADITWSTNSATQTIAYGKPWLNVRKPDGVVGNSSKVNFTFLHATSKFKVTVQTDNTDDWIPTDDATATKVWIRSIRFTGIAKKAALNLNNPKANIARWIDYYGSNELEMGESVTVYDGRKDGSEGVVGAESVSETVLGLNPQLIQDENQLKNGAWNSADGARTGVPSAASVNLFCKGDVVATEPIFVIPTGEKVDVEIVYDIETIDSKLPVYLSDGETHGSTVENRIMKKNVFAKLESGKSYVLNLKLGMKDVKFNATVNDVWGDDIEQDVYLPQNMPSFAAGTPASVTVPYSAVAFSEFTITGLEATKNASITGFTADTWFTASPSVSPTTVPANGCVTISGGTIVPNTTVTNHTKTFTVKDDGSVTPATTVTVTQEAKPFVIKENPITVSATTFDIEPDPTASGTVGTTADDIWNAAIPTIAIQKKNGSSEYVDVTGFTATHSTGVDKISITVLPAAVAGDTFKFTIKVGDAPVTSKEITVSGS